MSEPEVTEADRKKATLVVARLPISLGDYKTRDLDAARDVIAVALAAERAKTRAPFLALAEELERHADLQRHSLGGAHEVVLRWLAFSDAAANIRRAAEETE